MDPVELIFESHVLLFDFFELLKDESIKDYPSFVDFLAGILPPHISVA